MDAWFMQIIQFVGFGLLGWFLVMAYVVTAPGIKECLRMIKLS